jgi:hypothetical protein
MMVEESTAACSRLLEKASQLKARADQFRTAAEDAACNRAAFIPAASLRRGAAALHKRGAIVVKRYAEKEQALPSGSAHALAGG